MQLSTCLRSQWYEKRSVTLSENHTSMKEPSFKNALSLPRKMRESEEISAYSVSTILFKAFRSATTAKGSSSRIIARLSLIQDSQAPGNHPGYLSSNSKIDRTPCLAPISNISASMHLISLSRKALMLARARISRSIFRVLATSSITSMTEYHLLRLR